MSDEQLRKAFETAYLKNCGITPRWSNLGKYADWWHQSAWEWFKRGVEAMQAHAVQALDGIDRQDDEPGGWWETSTGAAFGASVLAKIKGGHSAEPEVQTNRQIDELDIRGILAARLTYWHTLSEAESDALVEIVKWEGIHHVPGVNKLVKQPRPLTDAEISECYRDAVKAYRKHRNSPGPTPTNGDRLNWHFAKAVEEKVLRGLNVTAA